MRLVILASLNNGVILDCAIGKYSGKETGEHALARQILSGLRKGDILLGDRYYPSYFLIAELKALGVDGVFQSHRSRSIDFRKGKHLGTKDHLVVWIKPPRPSWMSEDDYNKYPEQLTVREVSLKQKKSQKRKVLVTTMVNAKNVTKNDLKELYDERWFVEITLRYVKEAMGMDHINAKTPSMIRKTIWVTFLAYNLTRKIMLKSAIKYNISPLCLSFKLSMQMINSCLHAGVFLNGYKINNALLAAISYKKVGNRKGRSEPRLLKQRKKGFSRMQKPRAKYKAKGKK